MRRKHPIKALEEAETLRLAEEALKKKKEEEWAEAARQAKIDEEKRILVEREAAIMEREVAFARQERDKAIAEKRRTRV